MKMTIITSAEGEIIGFAPAHGSGRHGAQAQDPGAPRQHGVKAGPGQKVEEVEVPDDLAGIEDGERLHSRLKEHLKRNR